MTDLTRYINLGCRHMSICDSVEKDTTLQDIADAWNEFKITENEYAYRGRSISFDQLAAKLDGLERGDE